ncbi:MAG: hypothetical protein WC373_01775 [Smithella sp.]|jgi:hypothetical protein
MKTETLERFIIWGMVLIACMAIVGFFCSCTALKDKSISFGGGGAGGQATFFDPKTGSILPFPQVTGGIFDFFYIDIPVNTETEYLYMREEKSLWSAEVATRTVIYIRGGDAPENARIKISIEPEKYINAPGLKIYGTDKEADITLTPDISTDTGKAE